DGNYTLCVIGKDSAGNYQSIASATTASWIYDSSVPQATIAGHPTTTPNNVNDFVLDVGGVGVVSYKYKIGINAVCSDPAGYSAELLEGTDTPITLSSEGTYVLCAVAKNAADTWQPYADATDATWVRDVTPPGAFTVGGL